MHLVVWGVKDSTFQPQGHSECKGGFAEALRKTSPHFELALPQLPPGGLMPVLDAGRVRRFPWRDDGGDTMVNPPPGPQDSGIMRLPLLQLQESERRNRLLAENSLVGMWYSLTDGSMLYANPAMADILEFDSVDLLVESNLNSAKPGGCRPWKWTRLRIMGTTGSCSCQAP